MDKKRIEEIMNADADYPSEQYVHMMGDYGGITGGELRELCCLALRATTNSEPLAEKWRQVAKHLNDETDRQGSPFHNLVKDGMAEGYREAARDLESTQRRERKLLRGLENYLLVWADALATSEPHLARRMREEAEDIRELLDQCEEDGDGRGKD